MSQPSFGVETTWQEVCDGVDLTNKVVLITGTSDGLGVETARAFLSLGATVIGAVRNLKKMATHVPSLIQSTGNSRFESIECNLASFNSIRECARVFKSRYPKLDYLVCNAGITGGPKRRQTKDGLELTIGIDHFGHFLLTSLLVDYLIASAPARVIVLSSSAHKEQAFRFDDFNWKNEYKQPRAYGQAKTANILFARELNRRFGEYGVMGCSVHPGVIKTNMARSAKEAFFATLDKLEAAGKLYIKSLEQGVATTMFGATAPVDVIGGKYLEDCRVVDRVADGMSPFSPTIAPHALCTRNDAKLWELSEKVVGCVVAVPRSRL